MITNYTAFEKQQERGAKIAMRRQRNRGVIGLLTILLFSFCGTGLAIAIQAGMSFKYENSPELLNSIFIYMGFPGRVAQYLYDNSSSVHTISQNFYGQHFCVAVNAVAYTVFLLAWFLRPGDNRIKRDAGKEGKTWHHLAD